jgi:hypothetical protein
MQDWQIANAHTIGTAAMARHAMHLEAGGLSVATITRSSFLAGVIAFLREMEKRARWYEKLVLGIVLGLLERYRENEDSDDEFALELNGYL